MTPFVGEILGTLILVYLGNSVISNVLLKKTKGEGAGWLAIALGWGFALVAGIYAVGQYSGAHLNPAVTIGFATVGDFPWDDVLPYIIAQMIGGFIGAILVYLQYLPHWGATKDKDAKLAAFTTGPAIHSTMANLLSEVLGTFMLVLGIMFIGANNFQDGWNPLLIGLLLFTIGLTIGGTTGFSLNPARDLPPRLAHALLPLKGGKRDSDWSYSWIPVVGPIIGGIYAATFHYAIFIGEYSSLFWIFTALVVVMAIAAVVEVNARDGKEA